MFISHFLHTLSAHFGSLGSSFDMLVQYSDSQSQWRLCMLVPLRGVINAKVFQWNQILA